MSTDKISKVAARQAEQKTLAIAVATSIYHYKWIAASIGIHETTIHDWLKDDKDFASQLDQARASFINKNMRKARPDFLLETADRETFGRKQEVAVTGNAIQAIIDKYGGSEGVDEVPPITTTEERPPT
jgi:hypothetical protein